MYKNRYNLTRFNLSGASRIIYFSRSPTEIVECVAGGRIYKSFSRTIYENIHSHTSIVSLISFRRNAKEVVLVFLTLRKLMLVDRKVTEDINNASQVVKNMYVIRNVVCEVKGAFHLGRLFYFARNSIEIEQMIAYAGKIMFIDKLSLEKVNCNTSAGSTIYTTLRLNVTIPPGGEIRINSDVFTAAMGLTNILYAYSGDWIFLKRDTTNILLENGTGGKMLGEMIYNERYI